MTDTESQLRAILRERAADCEHLLDEVLSQRDDETLAEQIGVDIQEECADSLRRSLKLKTAEAEGAGSLLLEVQQDCIVQRKRADALERSLSALREAAGELAEALAYDKADDSEPTRASRRTWDALTALRERLAAHDAAPVQPTLTLEEVRQVACATKSEVGPGSHWDRWKTGVDALEYRLAERLAQKGAGRG